MPQHRFRAVRLLAIAFLAIAEPSAAFASTRNALIIGNSSYRPGYELRNPVADARAVAKSLSQLGFAVTIVEDTDLATAQRALYAFVPAATAGDAATLRLARNEILARRGGRFGDPALTAHFEQYAWYRPTTFEPVLGEIEQNNVELIRRYQLAASAPQDGFIFADSDRRLLTPEEIEALDKGQLAFARNEIYARRGRKFAKPEFRDHFSRFSWYKPQFGEVELTFVERKNVDLIRKYEK